MKKSIYCPGCGRKVATYDGIGTINIRSLCKKCNRHVIYNPERDEARLVKIPERNCSSGVTFY